MTKKQSGCFFLEHCVEQQEGRKYTRSTGKDTVGAEHIGYHRPRQHRKSSYQLGRGNSHRPWVW